MPLFSVIVPAYNAAKYISDTINSVLAQKMNDFELIIINDGSSDNTAEILNNFAAIDKRVRVYNMENSGPALARNKGIEISTGKYIMFLDSDDTYSLDAFESIYEKCTRYNFDLLIFGFKLIEKTTGKAHLHFCSDVYLKKRDEVGSFFGSLYKNNQLNQVWNKVYLSRVLKENQIRFQDFQYGEDRLFVFDVLLHCHNVIIVNNCLYNYFIQNENSLISKYYSKKFEVCNLIDDRIAKIGQYFGPFSHETNSDINYMYLKTVISCIVNLYHPTCRKNRIEKHEIIQMILSNSKVCDKLRSYRYHGVPMSTIVLLMKTKNVFINSLAAQLISFISKHFTGIFIRLKHPFAKMRSN